MFDVVLVFLTAFELYSNFVTLKTWVLFFATDCIATFSINCVTIIQICLMEGIQTCILHAHDVSGHVQMISVAVGHTRPHCQVSVVIECDRHLEQYSQLPQSHLPKPVTRQGVLHQARCDRHACTPVHWGTMAHP